LCAWAGLGWELFEERTTSRDELFEERTTSRDELFEERTTSRDELFEERTTSRDELFEERTHWQGLRELLTERVPDTKESTEGSS
jgi:hypothetical protein